jgi:hypothetical protein
MQTLGEGFVLRAIADEAAVELDGLHRAEERREILDQCVGDTAAAQKGFRDLAV